MRIYPFFLLIIALFFVQVSIAQNSPNFFNYQAVAHDNSGNSLINENIMVRIGIISDSIGGTLEWEEDHSVTTNEYGLFTLKIGNGNSTMNGSSSSFSNIEWKNSHHFLKVGVNTGSTFESLGIQQLVSVPYAMYANVAHTVTNPTLSSLIYNNGFFTYINEQGTIATYDINDISPWTTLNTDIYQKDLTHFVGIGTNSPSQMLSIGSLGTATGVSSQHSSHKIALTGSFWNVGTGENLRHFELSNEASTSTAGLGRLAFVWSATNTELMSLKSSGDLGLGTTTPDSKLDVNGTITLSSANSEINTSSTGAANMLPIAYGVINAMGNVETSSGNITSTWNGTAYEISISGENYNTLEYITQVTVVGGQGLSGAGIDEVFTNSQGGSLLVNIKNTAWSNAQCAFSFVVYKP